MARRSSARPRSTAATTCFGVGYEKIGTVELCALLKARAVAHVIDVRQSAWSYRQEYRKAALRASLEDAGIKYTHLPEAGNPFRPKAGEHKQFSECRQDYARFIGRKPDVLDTVHGFARRERVALLCYERDGEQCHRSVLVSQLRQRLGAIEYVDLRP